MTDRTMTDRTISPLRQRMAGDMTIRGFTPSTQRGSLLGHFLGDDVRGPCLFQSSLFNTLEK